jgi:hypothetical protein
MATLQQTISEKFIEKISELEEVDAEKIDQIRTLLANNKKPKPEDFIKIFSFPSGDLK